MKHVLVLAALALVATLAACGPGPASAGSDDEKVKVTSSPARNPQLVLGDEATTADNGTTLAVRSYGSPWTVGGSRPERGFEFSGIEVKGCAGPNSENSLMQIGPGAFTLRMPDGTSISPEDGAGVRKPALQSMNPLAGECGRGFVTFQTPRGERPDLVLYDEELALKKTIAWKLPEGR